MNCWASAALGLTLVGCSVAMRPPSTDTVDRSPARVERGRYLAQNLAGCIHCHSDHSADAFGWPTRVGTEGQGGFEFTKEVGGVPGTLTPENITPDAETGIGRWTDGEVERAIREGVDREGRVLFPMMPYVAYRSMSDEDVASVVAYVRSLKPISHATPPSDIMFPVSLFIRKVPKPEDGPVASPSPSNALDYGRYLVTLAGCLDCHTHHNGRGQKDGPPGAGGWELKGPWGTAVSGNITPDPNAGLGRWTRDQFIGWFKSFADGSAAPATGEVADNTPMPWLDYGGLTETDLGAIYDYLGTLEPVSAGVDTFPLSASASP